MAGWWIWFSAGLGQCVGRTRCMIDASLIQDNPPYGFEPRSPSAIPVPGEAAGPGVLGLVGGEDRGSSIQALALAGGRETGRRPNPGYCVPVYRFRQAGARPWVARELGLAGDWGPTYTGAPPQSGALEDMSPEMPSRGLRAGSQTWLASPARSRSAVALLVREARGCPQSEPVLFGAL